MAVAVVVVPFLIEFQDMVVVVPAKAVEVAGLLIFNAKFVLSIGTLLMSAISGLISVFSHESLTIFDPTTLQPIPYSPGPSQPSAMLANSSSHGNGAPGSTWIPDSGASFHLTGDFQNIKQFTQFDGPEQIFIGNGLQHWFLNFSFSQ